MIHKHNDAQQCATDFNKSYFAVPFIIAAAKIGFFSIRLEKS